MDSLSSKVQTRTHDHVSNVTSASHAHDMDSYANKLAEGSKKGIKFRLMEDAAKMDNGESSSSQQGRDKDYDGDSDVEVIYDEMEQSLKDNIGVVNEKRHELEELQEQIDKNPFDESLREMEARCMRDFETAALDEEHFMKQKSKIEWLSAGDANSAYFHRALKSKINKGRINSIVDSGGIFLQHDEVPDAFVNHYKVFLGSESSSVIVNRLNIFTSRLNSDTADATVPVLVEYRRDTYVWKDRQGNESMFSSSLIWNTIRDTQQLVEWEKMVWFPYCIPRHAFHMWLVFLGKLNTQDRMKRWDMNMMCCVFCYKGLDSHEHLFFDCDYSREVWYLIRPMINMQNVEGSWEDIRHRIHSQLKLKSARSIIERLVIGAASYYVWQERNARLFQNEVRSANQLSKVIIKTVHFRLQTIRFKGTRGNKQVLDRWNIKADMQMED
ncbi:hypothetical protein QVD17_19957 [Tagetes erecta]|uniref:Reverse transcriptase zinc-binding domain-containing protein n=1 Tax=Tagetes erecta TaxID=13708 RepID=A0AAD8NXN8_TARER|nr:hypothetical protein QVD17_19957 [Tagetes erecta]